MQLDLRLEAANLIKFQEKSKFNKFIKYPKPVKEMTKELILVEDYIHGQALCDYLKTPLSSLSKSEINERKRLAKIGLNTFFKNVFIDNFIHCDLHPGNIIIIKNSFDNKHSLAFLDAGLVTRLSRDDRKNFIELFYAIAKGDGKRAGELLIEKSRITRCVCPEKFINEIEMLVEKSVSGGLKLSNLQIGQLIGTVMRLCTKYQVKLESNFTSVLLSIEILEGIGKSLDPEIDILSAALPFMVKGKLEKN